MIGGYQVGAYQGRGEFAYQQQQVVVSTGGHGSADLDVFAANQRKTRQILDIKRRKAEVEAERLAREITAVEAEVVQAVTEQVHAEARAKDLVHSIDALTVKLEGVRKAKRPRLEAKREALHQERLQAVRASEKAALRARLLESHREELKRRRLRQEETEAVEALLFLMTWEDDDA